MAIYVDMENTSLHAQPINQETPTFKDATIAIIREYNKSTGFTDRKLTDTPTDALAVVNRNYVRQTG